MSTLSIHQTICMFFKTRQEAERFARQAKGRSWRKFMRLCPAGFYRGSGWIIKKINDVEQGEGNK